MGYRQDRERMFKSGQSVGSIGEVEGKAAAGIVLQH